MVRNKGCKAFPKFVLQLVLRRENLGSFAVERAVPAFTCNEKVLPTRGVFIHLYAPDSFHQQI